MHDATWRARWLVIISGALLAGLLGPFADGAGAAPAAPAAHIAAAAHIHPAAAGWAVQPADFPDGDPDVVDVEPDITAQPMCTTATPHVCARVADSAGDVWDGSHAAADPVKFKPNGVIFTWNGHNYHVGTLNMPGHSPACIGLSSNTQTTQLQNCSTGLGIIWGHGHSGSGDVWISRWATQADGSLRVLASTAGCFCGYGPLEEGDWFNAALYKRWGFG